MDYLGWLLLGLIVGGAVSYFVATGRFAHWLGRGRDSGASATSVAPLLQAHFRPVSITDITVTERKFPFRVRADLQRSLDSLFQEGIAVHHFFGVRKEYSHEGIKLSDCVVESRHSPAVSVPPEYEELDVGDTEPVRVLKNGLWLLESSGVRFAVMLSPSGNFHQVTGLRFEVGIPNSAAGTQIAQMFFRNLEDAVSKAESYRGKILSLEASEHSYSGESTGIQVHALRQVERDEVILPEKTLDLLERNVIQFARNRLRLAALGMSTRKGLLFYGPPGTGKTHTIHHLARALPGHTTLLISAEQVGLLGEYMTLARLLQPSIVVIEDVDLIARDRARMNSPCEEVLLNKLLNEMDGLKADAEILFLLTTNRPEALEAALASRPGRVDQAIEFPLPDDSGRQKLVRLYSANISLEEDVVDEVVRRTEGVSAAFIKELMRRAAQFTVERDAEGRVERGDLDSALDEMLFKGGSLNRTLLGATAQS